jgi:hypothetical protein
MIVGHGAPFIEGLPVRSPRRERAGSCRAAVDFGKLTLSTVFKNIVYSMLFQ